ncbi:hypothetical protein KMW28_22795 [Flammeovirga yaeyamensis]|uniref:Uncharacterized protein n=1 Tax=Flammeovirga yaeyamensis TaxID=367791 RepID=A0AAX1NDE8_9BACT|nr:methyltransferase [Flammeovirga yaeyamensis]MBB3696809.1 protein-S-isoprenylcysteine O-methyltransferase Ste14 [Flammeovirga yaeyamensis]NMF33474.1 hypothetical protein [Flammeovirga yaeyamensis]QWG05252.1 hypothetical protein KMW28_22795 [Flammeovirga yaeyamensis]
MEIEIIRSSILLVTFIFLGGLILKKDQNKKRNWAIFYSLIYVGTTLPIVNYVFVELGLWEFSEKNDIKMPYDLYFLWTIMWGVIPVFFLKKHDFKFLFIIILWLDLLMMPQLEKFGILTLYDNWILGEIALILAVFIPAYLWSYLYYYQKMNGIRAGFQVMIMILLLFVGLPYLLYFYQLIPQPIFRRSSIEFQVLLILAFPALSATQGLVRKGKGTPFPYDATKRLVRNGVYAYCRNPIQWSQTMIFFSLSYYHQSWIFLIGSIISVAYVFGVAEFQEREDMENRFDHEWSVYLSQVPNWYFLWKPINIPKGTIYFDRNCQQCSAIEAWYQEQNTINLEIKAASEYVGTPLTKVTYIDGNGEEENGINAIAQAFDHIHLGYASLGWFIHFYPISFLLQLIIDSMVFDRVEECEINNRKT